MRISACRSCMAPIYWAITTNGKRMPVDSQPSPHGSFRLEERPDEPDPLAVWIPAGHAPNLHEAHFVRCPNAAQHRKKGKK